MTPLEFGPVPEFQCPAQASFSPWGMGAVLSVCGLAFLNPWAFLSAPVGLNRPPSVSPSRIQHMVAILLDESDPDETGRGLGQTRPAIGIGRNQPIGGNDRTKTVDPVLLNLRLVPPISSFSIDSLISEVGDPTLPIAKGGNAIAAGHGNGLGWSTGNGLGSAGGSGGAAAKAGPIATEWGVLRKVPAVYPYQARLRHVEGYVVVMVTVDTQGHPIALRPLSGPDLLIPECLRVVKLWQFEPPGKYGLLAPATFPLTFLFRMDEPVATG